MNVANAIKNNHIDAGVGLENIQQVDLEQWSLSQGRPRSDVGMLRIDELADLGCCCFCSVLYIGNEKFVKENPEKVKAFMKAVKKATEFVVAEPEEAWKLYMEVKPALNGVVEKEMFDRSLVYFSRTLEVGGFVCL